MVFVAVACQQLNVPIGIILSGLIFLVLLSCPVANSTCASPLLVGEPLAPLQFMSEGEKPEWQGTDWTFVEESTDAIPSYYVYNDSGTGNTKR